MGSALDIGHIWLRKQIDLDDYISRLNSEGKEDHLEELKNLQDEGIETLIKVVEIKSDEEQDEATGIPKNKKSADFRFIQPASIYRADCTGLDSNNSVNNSLAM